MYSSFNTLIENYKKKYFIINYGPAHIYLIIVYLQNEKSRKSYQPNLIIII